MKQFFFVLFLIAGLFGQTVFAEEVPADGGDKPTEPAPTPDDAAPKPEGEEEEPDCE